MLVWLSSDAEILVQGHEGNTIAAMKCPNPQCGKQEPAVTVHRQPAISDKHGGTFPCVAYCCEDCGVILAIESDPLERNAQMEQIKKTATETKSLIEQFMRKVQSWSASAKLPPQQ